MLHDKTLSQGTLDIPCNGEINISPGHMRGCLETNVLCCARYLSFDLYILASLFYLCYVPDMHCINKILCFMVSDWVPMDRDLREEKK